MVQTLGTCPSSISAQRYKSARTEYTQILQRNSMSNALPVFSELQQVSQKANHSCAILCHAKHDPVSNCGLLLTGLGTNANQFLKLPHFCERTVGCCYIL